MTDKTIVDALQDKLWNMWFNVQSYGVYKFDGTTWTNYTSDDWIFYNDSRKMIIDPSGNISGAFWIVINILLFLC